MKKNFTDWTKTELKHLLGLINKKQCNALDSWLKLGQEQELTDFEKSYLDWLFQNVIPFIDNWNEAELRDQLISNLTTLVNFNSDEYEIGVFAERSLSANIDDITVSGKIDWMVASGSDKPLQPYFFVYEYKQEEGVQSASGRAQLISAMRVAQELNEDKEKPVYGCYVLGPNWFFVSLVNNHYCITNSYSSTRINELETILKILKAQKEIIIKRVAK